MTKNLRYGFEKTERGERLEIEFPGPISLEVLEGSKDLTDLLVRLVRRGAIAYRQGHDSASSLLAVNARNIGRIKLKSRKEKILSEVNGAIGALIEGVDQQESEPDALLRVVGYNATGSSAPFNFAAEINLPVATSPEDCGRIDALYGDLGHVATLHMANMARDLRTRSSHLDHINGRSVGVDIDQESGVTLSQSVESIVSTVGIEYSLGRQSIRLTGSNVNCLEEPLIYLAGLTGIADAAGTELVES